MSRIGVRPITILKNVKISVVDNTVHAEGPKGKLQFPLSPRISVAVEQDTVKVSRKGDGKRDKAMHGLTRAMIANMIRGVHTGYNQDLEVVGTGFRAQLAGKKLTIQLGFSHPIEYVVPEGITIELPKPTQIIIKGTDKQKVGQTAANIRSFFPPEPYKGKGVRYAGEQIRRKAGKAVAAK